MDLMEQILIWEQDPIQRFIPTELFCGEYLLLETLLDRKN